VPSNRTVLALLAALSDGLVKGLSAKT